MLDLLRVKDVMLPLAAYATVSSEATLREALVALSKSQLGLTYDRHHHRAVLVMDDQGNVVGKLTYQAILRSLLPSALGAADVERLAGAGLNPELMDSVARLSPLRANLPSMCAASDRVTVREAMVAARDSIEEGASLGEAIETLVVSQAESLLVTREGRVVGILRLSDVFEEVADRIRRGDHADGGTAG